MIFRPLRTKLPLALMLSLTAVGLARAGGGSCDSVTFWGGPRRPLIDFAVGGGSAHQRLLHGTPADFNQLELELGYARSRSHLGPDVRLDDKFLLFDYSASSLFGRSVPAGNIGTTMIRFGTGSRDGYAYDLGTSFLFPYHQTTFLWTKVTTARPAALAAPDTDILNRYEGSFRFGASTEGGIAFGFADVISLRVGYETSVIYPRYVFWPWLGSIAIASAGVGAISRFGREIVDASPTLGPVLYALLRSGVAYGYYLLARDGQYWPFTSETPLTTESLKIGITLTF